MKCRMPWKRVATGGATYTVTMEGFVSPARAYCKVIIDGTEYNSNKTFSDIPEGTVIGCKVTTDKSTTAASRQCSVTYPDGTTETGSGTYEYVLTQNVKITAGAVEIDDGDYYAGTITIAAN